uniref:Uncharacterized protein n=1 Tax=Tetradesmus obliquus TaxID=3088 RepID=A0A383VK75_TETOB
MLWMHQSGAVDDLRMVCGSGLAIVFLGVGQQLTQDEAGTPLKINCSKVPKSFVAVGYSAVTGAAVDAVNFVMAAVPAGNSTAAGTTAPPGSPAAAPASPSAAAAAPTGLFLPVTSTSASPPLPSPAAAAEAAPAAPAPQPAAAAPPAARQPQPAAAAAPPTPSPLAALAATTLATAAAPGIAAAPPPPPKPAAEESPSKLSTGVIVGIVASSLVGLSAIITIAYNLWKWANKHRLVAAKQLAQRKAAAVQLPQVSVPREGPLRQGKDGSLLPRSMTAAV